MYTNQRYPSAMDATKEAQSTTHSRPVPKTVTEKYADVTLRLIEDHGDEFGPLTPEKEKALQRKLYRNIMILISAINIILFVSRLPLCQAPGGSSSRLL